MITDATKIFIELCPWLCLILGTKFLFTFQRMHSKSLRTKNWKPYTPLILEVRSSLHACDNITGFLYFFLSSALRTPSRSCHWGARCSWVMERAPLSLRPIRSSPGDGLWSSGVVSHLKIPLYQFLGHLDQPQGCCFVGTSGQMEQSESLSLLQIPAAHSKLNSFCYRIWRLKGYPNYFNGRSWGSFPHFLDV